MSAALFLLKKIVSAALYPIGLVLLLWVAGLIMLIRRRRRAVWPLLTAGLILAVLSMPAPAAWLMAPLEKRAGPRVDPAALERAGVTDIVVLGGGANPNQNTPADQLSEASLKRLLEGIRLARALPKSRLILSGGGFGRAVSEGELAADLAIFLGMDPARIVAETKSKDTNDQAHFLADELQGRPFALVTSAFHIPRSLMLFQRQGLKPIPAPADFRSATGKPGVRSFIPTAGGLFMAQLAVHEYLGLVFYGLQGRF